MPDRILVIEDNQALAENVAELLADAGARITLCDDAEAGLRAAQSGFDLAIVDIGLGGGMSGLDLVPKLRLANSLAEVLLMTGNASVQSAIQAIRSGVYAYVQKPFDADQFTTLVHRALAQVALKRERQHLTQRLAASEALYRGVVDTAEACILGLDSEGVMRFANRFALSCLQTPSGALVGESFAASVHPAARERSERALARAFAGVSVRDHECQHLGRRTIRWMFTPLESQPDLTPLGGERAVSPTILAVGMDLTDRLDLERKNAEAEAMAVTGTLATSLAHEIRNPLNAARLQLELLQRRTAKFEDQVAAQRLREPVELVRQELTRLSTLLNDFLHLARPRQLTLQTIDLRGFLASVQELKAPYASSVGVDLRLGPTLVPLSLRADEDKLKQVLLNLVGNAIEALEASPQPDKWVELSGEAVDGGVRLTVADNGPGIPADIAQALFQPFVTSKQGGTGLGLSIVAKLVTQHGGRVSVEPRSQGGTIATCFLPD